MLMRYVLSYVSKSKKLIHIDTLYTSTLSPATTAFNYAMLLDIAEPEVWVIITSRKISWTNAERKQYLLNNLFAMQNLKMALKKANILQHTKSFFV